MTLYEIDRAIEDCIDPETGEVDDLRLTDLAIEREKKLDNLACWIKDMTAEAEALGTEIKNLQKRKKSIETKITSVRHYLAWQLHGQGFRSARAVVTYYPARQHAVVDDPELIPDDYKRETFEVLKEELRAALLDGSTIDGAHLEWGEASVSVR